MFTAKETAEKQTIRFLESTNQPENSEDLQKQELRRQMYERIAHGNALCEIEGKTSHQWKK